VTLGAAEVPGKNGTFNDTVHDKTDGAILRNGERVEEW